MSVASEDWRLRLPESRRRPIRRWLWAIAATTFLVIVVGGITRLTQSGLSIVDWQPLVGVVPPLNQGQWLERFERYQQFPEYRQLRPQLTLAEFKVIFAWEYLHRLLARAIALVVLVPLLYFYFARTLTRPVASRVLVLSTLGAAQGVLGWVMVRSGLVDRPSVSHYRLAAHLMLALAIFALCIWLIRELCLRPKRRSVPASARRRTGRGLAAVGVLLAMQIVWGALVAGLKAGFVFNTFPLMAGALVPVAFWTSGPIGLNLIQQSSGVQWMHRLLGTVLVAAAMVLYWRVRRMKMDRGTTCLIGALLWVISGQYALGVLTLVRATPVGLAVAHQALAAVIIGLWVHTVHHVRHLVAVGPPP